VGHTRKFTVIETHPGGGQYDCLSLYDKNATRVVDVNRKGRLHIFNRVDGANSEGEAIDVWRAMINSDDLKFILDEVCLRIGLSIPKQMPLATPDVLVYRFVAEFLAHTVFGQQQWECRNGFYDTSGEGEGTVDDFEFFPDAQERLQDQLSDDLFEQPAYRFWFLRREENALLCLETTGLVWLKDGTSYRLTDHYKRESRIWPVITHIAGHLLP
jgi:hypothetical protein